LINYLNKYSPKLAEVTACLRDLTKEGVPFLWCPEHTEAFEEAKQEIVKAPTLAYYDPTKEAVLQTDASDYGLGCVLLQNGKPVMYASKAIQQHERGYVAIEKEALAAAWAMEKFHHFLYAKPFILETDQKPLETILNRSVLEASLRLQRIIIRCLPYDFHTRYIKGKTNVLADCMSRLPSGSDKLSTSHGIQLPKIQVNCITSTLKATDHQLGRIRDATDSDEELSKLKHIIQHGWPQLIKKLPVALQHYWNFREQMTLENGIILKNTKIVIPTSLRDEMLTRIHEGHLGIEKCINRARSCIYWPMMVKDIEQAIGTCETCLKYARAKPKKRPNNKTALPLGPEIPLIPWTTLASDLFKFNNAEYLLLVDLTSNFPIIRKLSSSTAEAVIHQCKSVFAEYGIPEEVISDNGPCYDSKKFKEFSKKYSFTHTTSSPHHSEGNGFAERYVGIVKDLLTKAKEENEDPYYALLQYRITPLSNGKPSPMEILNKRKYSNLPTSFSHRAATRTTYVDELDLRRGPKHDPSKLCKQPEAWEPGTPVMVYDTHKKHWKKGVIRAARPEPNSYDVEIKGVIYRRTKQHIKPRLTTHLEMDENSNDADHHDEATEKRVRNPTRRLIEEK
jgi:transposase InsO family protein